jgi:allantoicase
MTEPRPDVTDLPDLASRRLGGSVVAASDELFAGSAVATHVRLDVIPDGGLARLRVNDEIVPEALAALRQVWWDAALRSGGMPCPRSSGRPSSRTSGDITARFPPALFTTSVAAD